MKVLMFTKSNQPDKLGFSRLIEALEKVRISPEILDPDTLKGADLAKLYDLVEFPAVVITSYQGSLVQRWQSKLPSCSEISYFYHL